MIMMEITRLTTPSTFFLKQPLSDPKKCIEDSSMSISETEVSNGLDFILSHMEGNNQPLFPRTISTKLTEGVQITVDSKEKALEYYKAADFLDCKINGYPKFKKGLSLRVIPTLIFIDLDQSENMKILNRQLEDTLANIDMILGVNPTVLWSGKGYHIYIPVEGILLENEDIFNQITFNPSRKFLQWSEQYLSNNKADPLHSKGISFANCMLRIPGSINSKSNQQVRIVKEWSPTQSTSRPRINPLLYQFYTYLTDLKYNETIIGTRYHSSRSSKIYQKYWSHDE